jgi:hypothetical protein
MARDNGTVCAFHQRMNVLRSGSPGSEGKRLARWSGSGHDQAAARRR